MYRQSARSARSVRTLTWYDRARALWVALVVLLQGSFACAFAAGERLRELLGPCAGVPFGMLLAVLAYLIACRGTRTRVVLDPVANELRVETANVGRPWVRRVSLERPVSAAETRAMRSELGRGRAVHAARLYDEEGRCLLALAFGGPFSEVGAFVAQLNEALRAYAAER
jgi:hypothetical protein